jgi:DNA replication protein DnaC
VSGPAGSELAYLSRALKAPRIKAVSGRLASRARDEGWDYEAYLAAVLAEEVSARDSHGGAARVKAARFPATKTLDDFDFTVQTSVSRQVIAHLAQLDFLAEAKNVVFLGPPGTGKTHLSIALGVRPPDAASGSPSPRRTSGSTGSVPPSGPGGSTTSSSGSGGSRC